MGGVEIGTVGLGSDTHPGQNPQFLLCRLFDQKPVSPGGRSIRWRRSFARFSKGVSLAAPTAVAVPRSASVANVPSAPGLLRPCQAGVDLHARSCTCRRRSYRELRFIASRHGLAGNWQGGLSFRNMVKWPPPRPGPGDPASLRLEVMPALKEILHDEVVARSRWRPPGSSLRNQFVFSEASVTFQFSPNTIAKHNPPKKTIERQFLIESMEESQRVNTVPGQGS